MTLGQRLKIARREARLSQAELSKLAGVSQTTINNIETGRNLGSKHVVQIADALNTNVKWLLDGTPPRLSVGMDGDFEATSEATKAAPGLHHGRASQDLHFWFDLETFERSSQQENAVDWLAVRRLAVPVPRDFFVATGRDPKDCKVVTMRGTAMQPLLNDRDLVLIDTAYCEPRDGQVFAMIFEGEPIIRQIFKLAGGTLVVHALSKNYLDRTVEPIHLDRLWIIGQCVYRSGSALTM
ncbi:MULTISPECIES: LexA family transcriptional regulator [unclassified Caballeronia]|uniref:XRE family transcriptional regulator n=1 Tax=unclassified Caballeronia TaxID=2646786 RepID=UPI00285C9E3F|nr:MULTISPECIES: LexA family transcriptional regulator [unclassified Caballeronia]MDR5777362.1 LexA family transcriptional regulator [Caballeronia sp. LZ002]MDR5802534.1 LexA family transcriptional regulator [Caballeronia sp. LZ001]MDR5852800.1 LexA family transcriptional regulator [Caballeronia sp. LZ003]